MILIDGYAIDAVVTEDHALTSDVTDHPVEEGSDITDHVRARPIEVTVVGVVSDTPIGLVADERVSGDLPSEEFLARLRQIRDRREPIAIETTLGVYTSMVLTALSIPRSAETGDALEFRASFRQIEVVATERTVVAVKAPRAANKLNRGHKPAKTTGDGGQAPSPPAERQSALGDLGDFTGLWSAN